jgi:hypothetical protein
VILDRKLNSEALTVNGNHLTLQSQRIGVKHRLGEFVWIRPVAVLMKQDGFVRRIPIIDLTRIITLFLWCLTLAFAVIQLGHFVKGDKRRE